MTGFMQAAIRDGARLERNAPVISLDFDENGICAVEIPTARMETRIFVNATGAWAASIGELADIDLAVELLRRMLVPTEPFDKISHDVR